MISLKSDYFFKKIPLLLTTAIPFFLITGPFLSDLALSLCAIIFLLNHYYNSLDKYFKSNFFKLFLIFWFTLITSSFFSSDIFYSLRTSFFYIRFGVFALSTWYLLDQNIKLIHYTFYVLIFSIIILLFDGYFQFFTSKNIFGWEIQETRVSSFFKEELILGSYLSRLFPLAIAFYIFIKKKRFSNLIFIIFVLTEVLIFISGERAAFFYLNLSAVFIILLSKNFAKIRLLMFVVSIFVISIITVFHNPEFKQRMIDKTLDQMIDNSKINIFSVEHESHYKSAFLMFQDHPILGIGPKMFRKHCDKKEFKVSNESCTTHPHNTYVQLLTETGILGFLQIFIVFLFLIYYSFKHLYLKLKKKLYLFNDFQLSLLSAAIISLWPLVPTGNFFTNWLCVIYFLPLGFLLYSFQNKKT